MVINSYVSKGFFEEFLQKKPNSLLSIDFKYWLDIYRFFNNRTTILKLGATKESIGKTGLGDELLYNLMNDYWGGKSSNIIFENLDDNNEKLNKEFNQNIFQFFFSSSQVKIDDLILKAGFPVYNTSNELKASSSLTNIELLPVSKNVETTTLTNWADLTKKLLPFHTIAIVDNYLFKSEWQIINNTIPLIKSLAESVQNEKCFSLSLFFCEEEKKEKINGKLKSVLNKDGKKNYQINIDDVYNRVEKELSNVFQDSKKFKLSIVRLNESGDFHDRVIFTNSQFMTSGNSFSQYFKDGASVNLRSPTILTIFPLIGEYQKGIWGEIAFEILEYLKSLINSKSKFTIVGEPIENCKLFN